MASCPAGLDGIVCVLFYGSATFDNAKSVACQVDQEPVIGARPYVVFWAGTWEYTASSYNGLGLTIYYRNLGAPITDGTTYNLSYLCSGY